MNAFHSGDLISRNRIPTQFEFFGHVSFFLSATGTKTKKEKKKRKKKKKINHNEDEVSCDGLVVNINPVQLSLRTSGIDSRSIRNLMNSHLIQ
jgi:hypothetical protein